MKKTHSILDKILASKILEIKEKKRQKSLQQLKESLSKRKTEIRDFAAALGKPGTLNIMAEVKKASPSGGLIRKNFDHIAIAKAYQKSQLVSAMSVLTDEIYFQGNLSFISDIKTITTIPIFRKDFIIDEYQVYESYLAEADALLLIVAALTAEELKHLIQVTHHLKMECLVETHSKEEVETALHAGAKVIGINARDLKTFTLDKTLFSQLSPLLPDGIVKVAESGLETREELQAIYSQGANAALIGSSFMKAENINQKLKEVMI